MCSFLARAAYWSASILVSSMTLVECALVFGHARVVDKVCPESLHIAFKCFMVIRTVLACVQLPVHLWVLCGARFSRNRAIEFTETVLRDDSDRFYVLLMRCNIMLSLFCGTSFLALAVLGWQCSVPTSADPADQDVALAYWAFFALEASVCGIWFSVLLARCYAFCTHQTRSWFYLNRDL